ncbi:hypothetical protein PT276_05655 [Orbaceae bacterium ESL0721]|nr:hypothetical protein [Orbaceae bacterium ESL0721]
MVNIKVINNLTSMQYSDDYDYDKISSSIDGSAGFGGASGNLALDSTQMTSHWHLCWQRG